jgi:cysteine-rich repeat protein
MGRRALLFILLAAGCAGDEGTPPYFYLRPDGGKADAPGGDTDLAAAAGVDLAVGGDAASQQAMCGNGVREAAGGELCDDGNTVGGDGCAADCRSVECTRTESYEDPATHVCVWRDRKVTSRGDAATRCAAEGGYLFRWPAVALRDGAYPATLGQPGGRVWIGLNRVAGAWTWDDGTAAPPTLLNWRSGEPSGDGSCVEWRDGNGLNDLPCDEDRDFICARAPAGGP